jgi:cytochrome b6-f complex iron-sulfur subunit
VPIVLAILAVVLLAVITILVTARRRASVGTLARETRQRDKATVADAPGTDLATVSTEARDRTDSAKQDLAPAGTKGLAVATPVDEEALGETRRQFLNRGIVAGMGLALGALGVAVVGFLWPPNTGASGFGGVVDVGSLAEIDDTINNKKIPFYNAAAKTYVVAYPKADLPKAKKVPNYAPVFPGMKEGYVTLYQKCVHLGCRVPFCVTSQWFECPCHGSKYNRVGEKRGGPAPRGLDRFIPTIVGGRLLVDTGVIVQGPPIGTDTTGQSPEGAPCV